MGCVYVFLRGVVKPSLCVFLGGVAKLCVRVCAHRGVAKLCVCVCVHRGVAKPGVYMRVHPCVKELCWQDLRSGVRVLGSGHVVLGRQEQPLRYSRPQGDWSCRRGLTWFLHLQTEATYM